MQTVYIFPIRFVYGVEGGLMKKIILILGIIFLLAGISINPIVSSISKVKQSLKEKISNASIGGDSGISLITVKVGGEMGLNDWYVSDVGFNFTYESDDISLIKYLVNQGPLQNYTESFLITEDGKDICLEWCAVDNNGNQSEIDGPFIFNKDKTRPMIDLTYEWEDGPEPGTWWVIYTANCIDATSGMSRVDFYINGEFKDTVYGPGPEYVYRFLYDGTYKYTLTAVGFDNAGNSMYDELIEIGFNKEESIQNCFNQISPEITEIKNDRFTEKSPYGISDGEVFDPAYVIVVFNRKMGENNWIIRNASISIFYESDRIAEVYYKIDDGEWILYNEPIVILDDGNHSLSWFVIDSEGFISTPDSIFFKIDKTCPEINLIKNRIAINKVKFIADVYDEMSNINKVIFYEGYSRVFTDTEFPYEWIWTGFFNNKITVKVYDNAGNINISSKNTHISFNYNKYSTVGSVTKNIIPSIENLLLLDDTTPPITTHTLDPPEPDGDNGWYVSDVEVTLNATDDISGVMKIQYRIDGGPIWTIPGDYGTFIIDFDKENIYVEYWAVDNACNDETHHTFVIDVDRTDPVMDMTYECEFLSPIGGWLFIFNATAFDETSQINYVRFLLNDVEQDVIFGEEPIYSWEWKPGWGLNTVIRAEAYDNAGNMAFKEIKDPRNKQNNIQQSTESTTGAKKDNKPVNPSNRGTTLYVGGGGPGNYSKIQDAVDNASDGDTVFVYDESSPYYEHLVVNISINLIGEDKNTTVIDGNNKGAIIEINKDKVKVSGFTLINGGSGIDSEINGHTIISDNHFVNFSFAIMVDSESFIISNTFREFFNAIYCHGGRITISDNIIISSTEMHDGWGDIECSGSNNVITNNTIVCEGNKDGRKGLCLEDVRNSIIKGNEFRGYGGSWSCAIELLLYNRNNIISYNNITNNDCGIDIWIASGFNKITNNNFINNNQDAFPSYLSFNNRWDGNYWDKWIGFKYNLSIFQNFPHIIFWLFGFAIDWHPASEPYDITNPHSYDI